MDINTFKAEINNKMDKLPIRKIISLINEQKMDDIKPKDNIPKSLYFKTPRKIRYGIAGGGPDSFVGPIHRMAANLDGNIELKCGVFSSIVEKCSQLAEVLHLDHYRWYRIYEQMLLEESRMPPSEKVDFFAILTPNHLHYLQAKLALCYGFNVLIDTPISLTSDEAKDLKTYAEERNLLFCITYNYTGYPLIKEARQLVKTGKIGKIRKIFVDYPQQVLSTPVEKQGNKQAQWRVDPKKAGFGGCIGDIGVHAFNLMEYVSNTKVEEICCDLSIYGSDRSLDDDASILLRLENGIKGVLVTSQVLPGEENVIKFKIWGELGGLEWSQTDANSLILKWLDKPFETYRSGNNNNYLSQSARENCRIPGGFPEGFIEAFANIYRNFAMAIAEKKFGFEYNKDIYDYPDINEGIRGMLFIEKCVENNKSYEKWTKLPK